MSQTIEFCQERADEAAAEARDAKLENVRERALRSEAAWLGMANRARLTQARRARQAEEAALAREAEAPTSSAPASAEPIPVSAVAGQ